MLLSSLILPLAATGSSNLTEILVILVGSGGAVGIVATLLRMPTDRSASAVTQAQGAMETMNMLNATLKQALADAQAEAKRQRDRADFYRAQLEDITGGHTHRASDRSISAAALRRGMKLHPDDEDGGD